jgi:hypothetical protein
VNLPHDLPDAPAPATGAAHGDETQAQWEMRATLLAKGNQISRTASPMEKPQSYHGVSDGRSDVSYYFAWAAALKCSRDAHADLVPPHQDDIQEAIRLHEEGGMQHVYTIPILRPMT